MTILGWVFLSATVIVSSLYWRGVNERNHLTNYVGRLLLDDALGEAHKQKLERLSRGQRRSECRRALDESATGDPRSGEPSRRIVSRRL